MNNSYKVYASQDYVDSKGLPDGQGAYQQLVTDSEGNAKWEDREFYIGGLVETTIMEADISFYVSDGMGQGMSPIVIDIIENNTYTVVFDGTEYKCVGKVFNESYYYFGNGSIWGLEDTGEPFMCANAQGQCLWLSYDGTAQHTIKVATEKPEVIKLDSKFIPWDDAPQVKPTYIINSFETLTEEAKARYYEEWKKGAVIVYENEQQITGMFYSKTVGLNACWLSSEGNLITYQDGVGYSSIGLNQDGIKQLAESAFNEQRVFTLYNHNDGGTAAATGDLITARLKWMKSTNRPYIHEEYSGTGTLININNRNIILEGDKNIILSSNTEGSTKKFSITVDDSGTPTLTNTEDSTLTWTSASVPIPTTADAGKILRVQSDGSLAFETLQTEEWTFTLDDGTEVVKNVVVL